MPLQKRRMGPARIHHRRSAWSRRAAHKTTINQCPNCEAPRIPHRVCQACGHYNGEAVIEVKKDDEE